MWIQFRRAACKINDGRAMLLDPLNNPFGDRSLHHFRSPRCSVDMAVPASLVAFATDIDLKGLESSSAKSYLVALQVLVKPIHSN